MYLDDRRRFFRDIQTLGSENWYIWLDAEERANYSKLASNYMDSFGNIKAEARSLVNNLMNKCKERATDSERNRVNQGAFRAYR